MPDNVLYIHSHDTGRYVQPYGHAIPTPNIQWLADQGIMFRNAFCAAPSCSGSRAALLTGEYCHMNGMMGLAHRGFSLNDYDHQLVRVLSAQGYHSELIGEQHVSADPHVLGYDVVHEIPDTPGALGRAGGDRGAPRRHPGAVLHVGRVLRDASQLLRAQLGPRSRLSLPPPFLPDTPEIREDIAAYKASARSLDHGVGSVLNALQETGLDERTLVIFTTDHGLAFPTAKASLLDRGIGVSLIIRGPGFTGGRALDALVSHLDIFPTVCEAAGAPPPPWLAGHSLLPLVAGEEEPGIRSAVFSELTYHAAYEPQRAIRTERYKYIRRFDDYPYPVLPNCDDSPSKNAYLERGWATRPVARESLHDLFFNPGEGRNLIGDDDYQDVLADLRERLHRWMVRTDDPLLRGPIAPPVGARINAQSQRSAAEPTRLVEAADASTVR